MKRFHYFVFAGVLVLALLSVTFGVRNARAQVGTPTPVPGTPGALGERLVSVSGEGQANVRPDQASIRLGVETDATTAREALSANNSRMQSLLGSLQQAGIASADIQTQQVQLVPRYEQPGPQGGTPKVVGYTATNIVQVLVRDLGSLGTVLDAAVQAGGNRIEGVAFQVSNPSRIASQARQAAWADALAKAQQLAGLAGAELGEVLSITESSQTPQPLMAAPAVAQAGQVPVEPGTQTVTVDLQVTWALRGGSVMPTVQPVAPASTPSPTSSILILPGTSVPTSPVLAPTTSAATSTALPHATVQPLVTGTPTVPITWSSAARSGR